MVKSRCYITSLPRVDDFNKRKTVRLSKATVHARLEIRVLTLGSGLDKILCTIALFVKCGFRAPAGCVELSAVVLTADKVVVVVVIVVVTADEPTATTGLETEVVDPAVAGEV